MKRTLTGLLFTGLILSAGVYTYLREPDLVPEVSTVTVSTGDIVDTVGATGALEAVTTVQVGSQVSGKIEELYADFNSIVRAGEVIARLDPSLFETQVEQARANLIRAQADVERLTIAVEHAETKLVRAEGLSARSLIPATELEAAQVEVRLAQAQLRSSQAQMAQSEASLNQTNVNLEHTIITAPIDGIVISRSVDVGQTVAASMQAPILFLIAADLTKMKVNANIDESGRGPDQAGAGRDVPSRRLPDRGVRGPSLTGPTGANRRGERRDLRDPDRRAESRAQAQAGHDRDRHPRDRAA